MLRGSIGLVLLVIVVSIGLVTLRAKNGEENRNVKALLSPVKLGQVYRSLRDVRVDGLISYKGPVSSGFHAVLPANTLIVITNNPPPGAQGVWALPLNYKELESRLVPEDKRNMSTYDSYGIGVDFSQLSKFFELKRGTPVAFDDAGAQKEWELIKKYNPAEG